jgi:GT2 family glycosyltransferase
VLVAYNSSDVIADALRSIPPGHQVIVVDNASTDNSVEICRSLGATVLEMQSNLGFGTACNRGADIAEADAIFFLNPDARLKAGSLDAMQQALLNYPDTAAFNPRLLNDDGNQFLRRRTILLPRPYWFRPPPPTGDEELFTLSGAALVVRRSIFKEIDGFDENIFLYYEDDDLSTRLIKKGFKFRYIHNSVVVHGIGKSTQGHENDSSAYFREYEATKSRLYVSKKHGIRFHKNLLMLKIRLKLRYARMRGKAKLANALEAKIQALHDFG